jgi:hypothetical protein
LLDIGRDLSPHTPCQHVDFSMEDSVTDKSEQVLFSFVGMNISASGQVAFIVAAAVFILIIALAWRLVR